MLESKYVQRTISLLILIFVFACDAPRENPFDPNATNAYGNSDQARTNIQLFHLPPSLNGISGVKVYALELDKFTFTNEQGIASFEHLLRDSLTFEFEKDGYFNGRATFTHLTKENNLQFRLNAMPVLKDLNINSVYVNNEGIDDFTSIGVKAQLEDLDGRNDILSVYVREPFYNFMQELTNEDGNEQKFSASFFLKKISSVLNPEQVPELEFELIAKNISGDSIQVNASPIRRVIMEHPLLLTPQGTITQSDSIRFSWQPVQLNYQFSFNLVLYYSEIQEFLNFRDIPSSKTEYFIHGLLYGHYQTYLQIEDSFGNICQAPFKSFNYQP